MANADDLRNLAEEMVGAYKDRVASLGATRKETARLLNAFQKESGGRHREVKARVNEVTRMIADFDKAHKEMGTQLKATLAEVKPALEKDEADRVAQAQAETKARVDEVKAKANETIKMLAGFRGDQAKTAAAWQNLIKAMEAKRKAKPVVEKVVPKVKEEVKVVE
ncbi:MAG: hypothetical protein Q8M92_02725, partial [Candidatus Subteraquimicrobiales bacterium]|nr:hypothetical protein [Candidatus Subteraquimicrobiales bacterium]